VAIKGKGKYWLAKKEKRKPDDPFLDGDLTVHPGSAKQNGFMVGIAPPPPTSDTLRR